MAGKEIKPNIISKSKNQKRQIISDNTNETIKCKIINKIILNLFLMTFLAVYNNIIIPVKKTTAPRYKFNKIKSIKTM